jgi:hypothetical protein
MRLQKEVSSTFRRSLMVAIPVATVVGATVLVYAGVQYTFNSGDPLSSSKMNANFSGLDSRIAALEAATGVGHDGGVTTLATVPVGTVMAFAGPTTKIPAGWLLCDGSVYDAATEPQYAALFQVIGTASGGTTSLQTFNVPDYRGRFLRGVDNDAGVDPDTASRTAPTTGGNAGGLVGSVQADELGSHSHGASWPLYSDGCCGGFAIGNSSFTSVYEGYSTLASGGNETRPKNVYVNYIIKY